MKPETSRSRRHFLKSLLQAGVLGVAGFSPASMATTGKAQGNTLARDNKPGKFLRKPIPGSDERIPVIGLGTSRTFNVGNDPRGLEQVSEVMRHFFAAGGSMIDSSPMYGSSQPAVGHALNKLDRKQTVFSADKVWTPGFATQAEDGTDQVQQSLDYWQLTMFDLLQIHNLVDWEIHIKTLQAMKQAGQLRYTGITTSHGRQHAELEQILKTQELDFVQFSYNVLDREVERRLLPTAMDSGMAVIINRPFQRGDLIARLEMEALPDWASEIQCQNWPQFLLKFVVSHPGVTCAIPATSQVAHVKENMAACYGDLPDAPMRQRMIKYVERVI